MDETTIDLPDAIREGCALRLTRDVTDARGRTWPKGAQVTCCGRLFDAVVTEVDARLTAADVVIDLDAERGSGQWAVGMWLKDPLYATLERLGYSPGGFRLLAREAAFGMADPVQLRRVALALAMAVRDA